MSGPKDRNDGGDFKNDIERLFEDDSTDDDEDDIGHADDDEEED